MLTWLSPLLMFAAGSGLSAATVSDLHELRALLVEAKAENDQLRAERDEVGRLQQTRATVPACCNTSSMHTVYKTSWLGKCTHNGFCRLHHHITASTTAMAMFHDNDVLPLWWPAFFAAPGRQGGYGS